MECRAGDGEDNEESLHPKVKVRQFAYDRRDVRVVAVGIIAVRRVSITLCYRVRRIHVFARYAPLPTVCRLTTSSWFVYCDR